MVRDHLAIQTKSMKIQDCFLECLDGKILPFCFAFASLLDYDRLVGEGENKLGKRD